MLNPLLKIPSWHLFQVQLRMLEPNGRKHFRDVRADNFTSFYFLSKDFVVARFSRQLSLPLLCGPVKLFCLLGCNDS